MRPTISPAGTAASKTHAYRFSAKTQAAAKSPTVAAACQARGRSSG